MRIKAIFAIAICTFILTGLIASMAVAGALTLNPALTRDGEGLNFVAEGIGLEGLGAGTVNLTIDIGGPVQAAYLYWAGSGPTVDNQVTLDGTPLTADHTHTGRFTLGSNDFFFFSGFGAQARLEGGEVEFPVLIEQGVVGNPGTLADAKYHVVVSPHLIGENNDVLRIDPHIGDHTEGMRNGMGYHG